MSLFTRRPSPAMIVAVVALSFALAGSAIAGPDAATREVGKSQVKKIAKKQAKKQINKLASGLSVANAQNAVNAQNATTAETAGSAPPFAFAFVDQDGNVDSSLSRNISSADVDNPDSGVYCFQLDFQPVTGQATAEADGDSNDFASIDLADQGSCPSSAEVAVETVQDDGSYTNEAFYIQLGV